MPLRAPVARPLALVTGLAVTMLASAPAVEPPENDARPEVAKHEPKPAEPVDRPAPNDSGTISEGNPPPPAPPPAAAAPARDAAKPARPGAKQRPPWPPPPELIS